MCEATCWEERETIGGDSPSDPRAVSSKKCSAPTTVVVHTYGNVLSATAFLHGLVQEELTRDELEYHDPNYEVTIGVKATKRSTNDGEVSGTKGLVSVTIPFL